MPTSTLLAAQMPQRLMITWKDLLRNRSSPSQGNVPPLLRGTVEYHETSVEHYL
jgi:hypothetical protein